MSARNDVLAGLADRSGYELKGHDEASATALLDAYRNEVLREEAARLRVRAAEVAERDDPHFAEYAPSRLHRAEGWYGAADLLSPRGGDGDD